MVLDAALLSASGLAQHKEARLAIAVAPTPAGPYPSPHVVSHRVPDAATPSEAVRVQYKKARLGIAVAPTPAGPYVYHGSFQPHGQESRDFTVFQARPPHARSAPARKDLSLTAWMPGWYMAHHSPTLILSAYALPGKEETPC